MNNHDTLDPTKTMANENNYPDKITLYEPSIEPLNDYEALDSLSADCEDAGEIFELEPLPDVAIHSAEYGQRKDRRSRNNDTVDAYEEVLLELKSKITEICRKPDLTSELKTDLIRYAARQAGHPLDNNRIVQILCDEHNKQKYGSGLVVINKDQGAHWFQSDQRHIVEDLLMAGELNIIGGLSGAAKTNFTAMLLSALMNPDHQTHFLGFKVNRDLVQQVFFIGLDGGRNVYTPILSNTGLIRNGIPVDGFNFIPNESGWGITSTNLDKLEELLKGAPDSIVVVDSFLAAISGSGVDENSAVVAARILDLKLLCERYGATPILLAHQKKESTQEFTGADSLRGHGSIPAFAGQIITLNFLDQKTKVNGKCIPDRKSPKRRLVAGHRGTPIDLLVELDFQAGTVKSHGDFYEALFEIQQIAEKAEAIDRAPTMLAVMRDWNAIMKQVFSCLMDEQAPIDQKQLVERAAFGKGTVSKALKRLTEESYRGQPFVEVIESDRLNYWINDVIRREVNADY